ncbi:Fc.00g092810.m01.CDS01 [Cosmosporella sp. VM-42]
MGDQAPPVTTIPPFADIAKLPSCAVACDALYAANGGCVPPAVATTDASVYTACFCQNSAVAAFSTGSTGVCDAACTGAAQLASIQTWFQGICSVDAAANNGNGKTSTSSTTTSDASGETNVNKSSSSGGDGSGDWISNHWQWVVFLVVMVVAIAGIWVGACIWRRRYIRKKDRQTSLGQKHSGSASRPSWGPGMEGSTTASPAPTPYDPAYDPQRNSAGVFTPQPGAAAAALAEKPAPKPKKDRKRWIVKERT